MRRLIASSVAALMLTLGVPLAGVANGTAASVFGQVVETSGRGSSAKIVDLLQNGAVVSSTVTGFDGRFSINGIAPGTYVLRTMVNGRQTGVQVTLKAGQAAPVVVVLPTMVTAAPQTQFASLLANLSTTLASTTMATVGVQVADEAAAAGDVDAVEEAIINQSALTTLLTAVRNAGLSTDQLSAVASAVIQIAVSLPPTTDNDVRQALQEFINNNPTVTITLPGSTTPISITTPQPIFTASGTT